MVGFDTVCWLCCSQWWFSVWFGCMLLACIQGTRKFCAARHSSAQVESLHAVFSSHNGNSATRALVCNTFATCMGVILRSANIFSLYLQRHRVLFRVWSCQFINLSPFNSELYNGVLKDEQQKSRQVGGQTTHTEHFWGGESMLTEFRANESKITKKRTENGKIFCDEMP